MEKVMQGPGPNADHRFVDYYAQQSASDKANNAVPTT
jgi:hypothetical protein